MDGLSSTTHTGSEITQMEREETSAERRIYERLDRANDMVSTLSIPPFHSLLGLVPREEHISICADLLSTILLQQNIIDSLNRQLARSEGRRIEMERSLTLSPYSSRREDSNHVDDRS